jgi:hypothetical protein
MKNYTFSWEIQTVLTQFVAAFNDIVIKRYDPDKTVVPPTSGLKVNYVYAPKTRVYSTLTSAAPGGITVPAVAVSITGFKRSPNRQFNKNDGFVVPYNSDTTTYSKRILQPVPIDLDVSMTLVAKYQNDMDQMIANFVPYCDPYIVISWKLPHLNQASPVELRNEVLWSGDVRVKYPEDLQGNNLYRITGDTSFTIKTWLFKKMDNEPYSKIYVINSDYNATDYGCQLYNADDTEYMSLSARPQF